MKVKIFDKWIIGSFSKIAATISTAFSIAMAYIPEKYKFIALAAFIALLIVTYLVAWSIENRRTSISFKIRNTRIVVKKGDLFLQEGTKVIPVNNYFDTHVGDGVVDTKSLHGLYITKYSGKSPEKLSEDISESLSKKQISSIDQQRELKGKISYELGTVYSDGNGFLLVAYSRFDDSNRARLSNSDLVKCYTNMWDQIDIYRGKDSISLPVLGSGGLLDSKESIRHSS